MQRKRRTKRWPWALAVLLVVAIGAVLWLTLFRAPAPSASVTPSKKTTARIDPAYLDIRAAGGGVFDGEWDIPVDLLANTFHLPREADGEVTFETLKPHFHEMARHAYAALAFSDGDKACVVRPQRVEEANRGGAEEYLVLMFDVVCPIRPVDALTVDYRLFMAPHSSHTAILVVHHDGQTDSAFLSPARRRTTVTLTSSGASS